MKQWHQSKTMWLNIISLILGITPMINEDVLTALGVVDINKYLVVLGLVTGILNILLRTITDKGITNKKQIK